MMNSAPVYDFSQKTVLITGAAGGIGRALARGFSNKGAHVIVHDKHQAEARALANALESASYIAADFSSGQAVRSMIETIVETYSRVDVLINNAGIEIRKPYEEFSMEEYDLIFSVNLRSLFQLTKGLFPLLKNAEGACVINMSSVHQSFPYPTNMPYSMSKAAMGMFAKIASAEWAPYNIRVNNVAPGAIATEMNREAIDAIGAGKFASWIGSGKIGTTHDVVQACFFLASEASRYMSGETLFIDGALSKALLPYGVTPAMQEMREKLIKA